MSGARLREAVSGQSSGMARAATFTNNQTPLFITIVGISGWLLASLIRTPLPGAGPALLVPPLGALIMSVLAARLSRHILR
jgi:hypothetical protein